MPEPDTVELMEMSSSKPTLSTDSESSGTRVPNDTGNFGESCCIVLAFTVPAPYNRSASCCNFWFISMEEEKVGEGELFGCTNAKACSPAKSSSWNDDEATEEDSDNIEFFGGLKVLPWFA